MTYMCIYIYIYIYIILYCSPYGLKLLVHLMV